MELEKLQSAKKLFFIALIIDIAVTVIDIGGTFWSVGALKDIEAGVRIFDQSLQSSFEFWDNFSRLLFLTTVGVGLTLVKWLKSCYVFARTSLHATEFQNEGWITWGWIVPIYGFFKPYQVINEIYKTGSPNYSNGEDWKKENGSGLLLTWWIFWAVTHLIMVIISKEVFRKTFREDLTFIQINGLLDMHLWLCVLSIIIAGLWFAVANHLTNRLIARSVGVTNPQQPISTSSAPVQKTSSVSQPAIAARAAPAVTKESAVNHQPPVNAAPSVAVESSQQSMEEIEDRLYEQIAQEIETNTVDKGIWTKAFAQTGGDDKQTRVLYIKARFDRLMAAENARLEAVQREKEEITRREQELRDCEREEVERFEKLRTSVEWFDFKNWCKWGFVDKVKDAVGENPLLLAATDAISSGNTALHLTVTAIRQETAKFLADNGASVNARNNDGETPIDIAKRTGQTEIAAFLQQFSANERA